MVWCPVICSISWEIPNKEKKEATLLPRRNSQYLGCLLKHAWGYESRCDLVKGDAIDERQGHSNTPDPLHLKDKGQAES